MIKELRSAGLKHDVPAIVTICITFASLPVAAQEIGNCAPSVGEAYLDVNNVLARVPNDGRLFYRGEPHVYQIPRLSNSNAIFAGALWVTGEANGEVRAATTMYGPGNFWAGPVDENGRPPDDCSTYDRVYKVSVADVEQYEDTGFAAPDLRDWPTGLGAPTLDAAGDPIELLSLPLADRRDRLIDLAVGERPDLGGHQALWWVMNDQGNEHDRPDSAPLGIEVHVRASANRTALDAVNNTSLYRFTLFNRSAIPIENGHVGVFVDPDLGDPWDDYVGSDSVRGIGYVYNSDNEDLGQEGYGTPPPALGILFLEGPHAEPDQLDNDGDGAVDEPGERHPTTSFSPQIDRFDAAGSPVLAIEYHYYLQGRWKDGEPFTRGGYGRGSSETPVRFIYPGDPVTGEFWSARNVDGMGSANAPSDQRFLIASGPFLLQPGEETDFTLAVVWARGADQLDSVNEMKKAVDEVRAAFASNFTDLPQAVPPQGVASLISPAPDVRNQPTDPVLVWSPLEDADAYEVDIASGAGSRRLAVPGSMVRIDSLASDTRQRWRVRGLSSQGEGPWSDLGFFWTSSSAVNRETLGFSSFTVTANAGGPLDPPDMAALEMNLGFPRVACRPDSDDLCSQPTVGYQQSTSDAVWGIHSSGSLRTFGPLSDANSFLGSVTRRGELIPLIGGRTFEIRFTDAGGKAVRLIEDGAVIDVPFELWSLGEGTPDDPSDDFRMIPAVCESQCEAGSVDGLFDIGGDHSASAVDNDPFSDRLYWYNPQDMSPGEGGYQAYFGGADDLGDVVMRRMVLVLLNGGGEPPYTASMPETGTVFRIAGQVPIAPIPASPGDDAMLAGPSVPFYWNGQDGDIFRLEIARDPDFDLPIELEFEVPGQTVPLEESGRYYWRVRGLSGAWSTVWAFDLATGTSIESGISGAEKLREVQLFANYPNPFNPTTVISYELPEAADVRLEVFDVLGRRVRVLQEARVPAGLHRVALDAGALSSGVYFYTLSAGGVERTRRMVLLR